MGSSKVHSNLRAFNFALHSIFSFTIKCSVRNSFDGVKSKKKPRSCLIDSGLSSPFLSRHNQICKLNAQQHNNSTSMNRQIVAPAYVSPRDDETQGQQISDRICDWGGDYSYRASLIPDDPIKRKGDDSNNRIPEIDAFSTASTEKNLAWGKFDEEVLTRNVPSLGPLCLENDSCGRRKRRKHHSKKKCAPVGLSSLCVDPVSCHLPNPSRYSCLVLQPNNLPGANNTPESPLQPERFQYLFEYLGTKAHTRGISRSTGAPLYNLEPAKTGTGASRPRS